MLAPCRGRDRCARSTGTPVGGGSRPPWPPSCAGSRSAWPRSSPPSLLGFAVINSCTFAVDLGLLTALHGGLRWPLPVSITVAYITAFGLSYLLNRTLNFRSHGAFGPQVAVYTAVVIVNYLAWILGAGDGLAALGLDYRLARIAAGACEALYMYAAMRWLVFRDVQRPR